MPERDTEPSDEEHSSTDAADESVQEWLDEDAESGTPSSGGDTADEATADLEADRATSSTREEVIYETTPTIKPTLLLMGVTLIGGIVVELLLLDNPDVVGGPETAQVLLYVVAFLLVVAMLRFLVRMLVLERTTYRVTDDVIRREYKLLLRHVSREVPHDQVRAHELRKNRIQSLLGYGTVRFLTGGTNESLGFVAFENLVDPEGLRDDVRDVLQ